MTKVESILQTLLGALSLNLPDVLITRSRTAAFGDEELPAVNIKPSTDESINYAQLISRNELIVDFNIHVVPKTNADTDIDAIVVNLHEAIIDNQELQELVSNIQYKTRQWSFEDADDTAVWLKMTYAFTYLKPANEL